jgi:hypothetical protein
VTELRVTALGRRSSARRRHHRQQRMEPLWSPRGCKRWHQRQMAWPTKARKQAKTLAVGCDRLPRGVHGKEGVSGSSPSEGLPESARTTGLLFRGLEPVFQSAFGYTCQSGRGPFVVGVRGGECPPSTRRISMAKYLLSVHSVAGEVRDPMTEEEMGQFMERVGVLEEEMKSAGAWRVRAARRTTRRNPPRADLGQPATGARRLLARRRRQAPTVRPDGAANRGRPDRRDRRLPGSLAVRTMRLAVGADVGARPDRLRLGSERCLRLLHCV